MKYIPADKLIATLERQNVDKKVIEPLIRIITSLQQEQPEVQNGKFVFPKYLYARTKDNKTIDMSYAPQDMTAVEYIRNDFVEQKQPENKEKIMNFFDAVGDCGFSQHDILLLKNIWKETGCPPPKSQVADASKMEQPEVDLDALVNEAFDMYSSVDGYGQLSVSFNRAELYSFIKKIARKEDEK